MRITVQDNTELQDVMEASEFNGYLSPFGRKLIKTSLESKISLDLKAINQTLSENENGGYLLRQGKAKKRDDDEDSGMKNEDKKNEDSGKEEEIDKDDGSEEEDVHATIVDNITNVSKDYDIKDPFIKSDIYKVSDICISCRLIPCELEVYGNLLKKWGRT